jgi:hypothetical protein
VLSRKQLTNENRQNLAEKRKNKKLVEEALKESEQNLLKQRVASSFEIACQTQFPDGKIFSLNSLYSEN